MSALVHQILSKTWIIATGSRITLNAPTGRVELSCGSFRWPANPVQCPLCIFRRGQCHGLTLFYYHLVLVALVWLFMMRHLAWSSQAVTSHPRPAEPEPITPPPQRSPAPKPCAGRTHKPPCVLCEQETIDTAPPPVRPAPMPPTTRRPREVDASRHFCPHTDGDYRGWRGRGKLRANGHPRGGPWRQLHCRGCAGDFVETPPGGRSEDGGGCHRDHAGWEKCSNRT